MLMGRNISRAIKATRVSNAVAAGTTTINTSSVAMGLTGSNAETFQTCFFLVALGAVTSTGTGTITAQASTDNSTWAALPAAVKSYADTDSNKMIWVEVTRPREGDLYLRLSIARATANSVIDGVVAFQGDGDVPVTHDASTVLGGTLAISPARA